jgi:hypothetical protein
LEANKVVPNASSALISTSIRRYGASKNSLLFQYKGQPLETMHSFSKIPYSSTVPVAYTVGLHASLFLRTRTDREKQRALKTLVVGGRRHKTTMAERKIDPPVDLSTFLKKERKEKVPAVQSTVWKEDEDLSTSFHELSSNKPVTLKENVELIPMNENLLHDRSTSCHLITRQEQRAVISWAFKVSRENLEKRRFIAAIRGSPGIGKSWSALLYIRKLMQQKTGRRPIIFEHGSVHARKMYLIMTPKPELLNAESGTGVDEKWVVYRLIAEKLPSEWNECSIIDLVVDPAHFGVGETPSSSPLIEASGHIFIPVSPDDRHLGGSHKDASMLVELVMGPWLLKELVVAFPYMLFQNPKDVYDRDEEKYEDAIKTMQENYHVLGGLPRYLTKTRADKRKKEITPAKAAAHSQALLRALVDGKDFNDYSTEKVVTRYFTLRAGEDENGYNPSRLYATLDFVSGRAIKATGKIILNKILVDNFWRDSNDASDIGLAFERVVLMFLSQGTEGMRRLGIKTRCKQLSNRPTKVDGATAESLQTMSSRLVRCVLNGSCDDKVEEAPNNAAFETEVNENGKGMTFSENEPFSENELASNKTLVLPPDGYSNIDAMSGANLGFNATLQKSHSVSGLEYIRQRSAFGLSANEKFAHVFVVTPDRFDKDWSYFQNFSWTGDEATTYRKRRKVAAVAPKAAPQISQVDKQMALESMLQFVLTLEIEDKPTKEDTSIGGNTEDSTE